MASGGNSITYKNVVHDYAGGGRYRFTFGSASDFYVSVTGGEDAFTFSGRSSTTLLQLPDTIYHYGEICAPPIRWPLRLHASSMRPAVSS